MVAGFIVVNVFPFKKPIEDTHALMYSIGIALGFDVFVYQVLYSMVRACRVRRKYASNKKRRIN